MPDLPPDPERLRTLLAWLTGQAAENETVGIWLRLQRDAVRQALAAIDGQPARQQQPAPERPTLEAPPRRQADGYVIERGRTADGPTSVAVHLADCGMAGKRTHPVNASEARVAIDVEHLPACEYCRPDTELGLEG